MWPSTEVVVFKIAASEFFIDQTDFFDELSPEEHAETNDSAGVNPPVPVPEPEPFGELVHLLDFFVID